MAKVAKKFLSYLLRIFTVPLIFILVWCMVVRAEWVSALFIPSPFDVFKALIRNSQTGGMWLDVKATVLRMLAGFLVASGAGIPIGIILGQFKPAYKMSEFFIDFTRSIPATALFPLFMLVFGVGDASKIAIVAFSCFFVVLINSIYGVWNAPKTRILMARTFRANQFQIFGKIVFFDALPQIFAGLRNALSIALILTVVTEMFIGTKSGLGFLIFNAKIAYDTPTMYAIIILLGILGYTMNMGLLFIEKRLIHWSRV